MDHTGLEKFKHLQEEHFHPFTSDISNQHIEYQLTQLFEVYLRSSCFGFISCLLDQFRPFGNSHLSQLPVDEYVPHVWFEEGIIEDKSTPLVNLLTFI